MKQSKRISILAGLGMLVLILDSKTALLGAKDGITLCLNTLIPALFPFLFLGKLLGASGSVALAGLLGGYPVGAQAVHSACEKGLICRSKAQKLLCVYNQPGPAFLFGIGLRLFSNGLYCWLVWAVVLLSAALTGLLGGAKYPVHISENQNVGQVPAAQAVKDAVLTMGLLCGWVVLFRILLQFLQRWCLWILPLEAQMLLSGLLELAGGCCGLTQIAGLGQRFTLFAMLLSFGGVCVAMQTHSVAGSLGLKYYLPGKVCQGAISLLLSVPAQLVFSESERHYFSIPVYTIAVFVVCICALFLADRKKVVAFFGPRVYNGKKAMR